MNETFLIISILVGLVYCGIPILILFELYHWITRQNRVKYPLLMGTIFGLIMGMLFAFLITRDGSGESGMIGGGMAIIIFPASMVFGIIIGCFYKVSKRTIFLKKYRTTDKST